MIDMDTNESANDEERKVEATYDRQKGIAIASTAAMDRQNESIDQKGWQLDNFQKNPVMLWAHDHTQPAIGVAVNTRISRMGGEKRLVFEPKFHDKTDLARAIKALYEGDGDMPPVLNSFSVGFKPIDFDGETYTKQELLEISSVNVPANADARMLAYKSLKGAGFRTETMKELGIETELLDRLDVLEKDVKELKVVKAPSAVNPQSETKIIRQRLSMNKVIARAADKLLEADKKGAQVNQKQLIKVIKRANEILTLEEKEQLK